MGGENVLKGLEVLSSVFRRPEERGAPISAHDVALNQHPLLPERRAACLLLFINCRPLGANRRVAFSVVNNAEK